LGSQFYAIIFLQDGAILAMTIWTAQILQLTEEKTYPTVPFGSVVAIHNLPFDAVRDK
jgi:hypothetical protein